MGCSTCALSGLDEGELGALGLDCGPVKTASLPVRDVASLRVCALHERRLRLALGRGCACDSERQSQSGQGNGLEERSHAWKDAGGICSTAISQFMQNSSPPIPVFHADTMSEPRERADRCACSSTELKYGCRSPIRRFSQGIVAHPVGLVALQSAKNLPTIARSWNLLTDCSPPHA